MNNISLLNLQSRAARDYVHEQQGHTAAAAALLMADDSASGSRFTNFLSTAPLPLPPASMSSSWDLRNSWMAADSAAVARADQYAANDVSPPPANDSSIRQLFRVDDTISGDGRRPLGFLDLHQQEPPDRPAAATAAELTSVANVNDGMLIDLAAGLRRQSHSDSAAIFLNNAAPDSRRMLLNNLSRPSCSTASETEQLRRPLLHDLHASLSQIRGVTSGCRESGASAENMAHRPLQMSRQGVQKRENILQIRSGGFEATDGAAAGYGVSSTSLEPPLAVYNYGSAAADYLKYSAGFGGRIGLDLGGRTYFSTEDHKLQYYNHHNFHSATPSTTGGGFLFPAASTRSSMMMICSNAMNYMQHVPLCQAEGCRADLSIAKHYHRRHKVCEYHSKASVVTINGNRQRFCQQCSRFHALSEFDEGKRSCRKRLADHNRRRRKPASGTGTATSRGAEPVAAAASGGAASTDSNNNNGNSCDASSPSSAAGKRNGIAENVMEERPADVDLDKARMDVELRASAAAAGGASQSMSTFTMPPPLAPVSSTSSTVVAPSVMLTLQNDMRSAAAATAAAEDAIHHHHQQHNVSTHQLHATPGGLGDEDQTPNKLCKPPFSHDNSFSRSSSSSSAADSSNYLLKSTSLSLSNAAPAVVVNESFTTTTSGDVHVHVVNPAGPPAATFAALSSVAPPSSSSSLHCSFADDDGAELSRAAALPWLIRPSHARLSAASSNSAPDLGTLDVSRDCLSMATSTTPAPSTASMMMIVPDDVPSSAKQARADGQIYVCKSVERMLSDRQPDEQNCSASRSTSSLKDGYAVNHNVNSGGSNVAYLYNSSNAARTIDSNASSWAHLNLQRDQDYNLLPAAVCRSTAVAAPRQ